MAFVHNANRKRCQRRLTIESLEARQLLAGDTLVISELMASNGSTLADEDGDFSDWIELRNVSGATVSFDGWYLTDDAEELDKWQLPDGSIGPDQYLVLFASGKDRAGLPGTELHTNFKLSADGEFFALVGPDGTTIESQFAPSYPPQLLDTSYGISDVAIVETNLVLDGDTAQVLVPTTEDVGNWTDIEFIADDSWATGATGVGYTSAISILFVGAGAAATAGADEDVFEHLGTVFGVGNIAYKQASVAVAEDGTSGQFDVIVLSSTPDADDIRDKWEDATAGVLNWDDALFRNKTGDFQIASRPVPVPGQTQINITDASHPVTAEFATGVVTIFTQPARTNMAFSPSGVGVVGAGVTTL